MWDSGGGDGTDDCCQGGRCKCCRITIIKCLIGGRDGSGSGIDVDGGRVVVVVRYWWSWWRIGGGDDGDNCFKNGSCYKVDLTSLYSWWWYLWRY